MTHNNRRPKKTRRQLLQYEQESPLSEASECLDPSWSELTSPLSPQDAKYLQKQRQLPEPTPQALHLVISEDGRYPELLEFQSLDELLHKLSQLRDEQSEAQLFMFCGQRLMLTKGPAHHLLVPGQAPVPLPMGEANFEPDPAQSFNYVRLEEELEPADTSVVDPPTDANTLQMPAEDAWGDWGAEGPGLDEEDS